MKHITLLVILVATSGCVNAQITTSYKFDRLYRLTKITYANGSTVGYSYDANGNRVLQNNTSSAALPVGFTSFAISKTSCNEATLQWQTAQEQNNAGFEVQQSAGAASFKAIGFVKGNGTSSGQHAYQFKMPALADGNYYYRLKQTDLDGKFVYSAVLKTTIDCNNALLGIAPNPAQNQITITGLDISKPHELQLYDSKGMLLQSINRLTTRIINIHDLAAGLYFIRIDDKEIMKFLKQ